MAGRKKPYRGKRRKGDQRKTYQSKSYHSGGSGRRWSTMRRLKWAAGKVAFPLWVMATVACVGYGIANGDWMPTFWCGYVVYADFIFSL